MARNRAASGSPRTSSSAFPSVSDHSAPIATPLARDRVLATPAFSGVDREVPESPPQSLDRQVAARPGEDADAAALRDDLPDARHRQPHPAGQAPHLLVVIGARREQEPVVLAPPEGPPRPCPAAQDGRGRRGHRDRLLLDDGTRATGGAE